MSKDYFVMMWHNGFHDGPLSGIGIYQGNVVKFNCIDMDEDIRMFELLPISHEEMVDLFQWHFQFLQTVGWHTNYDLYDNNTRYDMYPYGKPENRPDMLEGFFNPYDKWKKKTKPKYPKGKAVVIIDEDQLRGLTSLN